MIVSQFEPTKPKKKKKLIILLISLCIVFCLVAGGGYLLYRTYLFTHSVFKSQGLGNDIRSILPVKTTAYSSDIDKSFKQGKTVNILLLGYGGAGHDGAYLTDSMMVISLSPGTKKVALISIPRDMWVQIPTSTTSSSFGKINSAYAIGVDTQDYLNRATKYQGQYGGGTMAEDVVSNILGVPINYFVSINFEGFKEVVDDLGGVDVNVKNTFDDYAYPSGDSTTDGGDCYAQMNTQTTCKYWHLHFNAGLQHMNGQVALEYVRSRHAYGVEGSDFARAQRQQNLISAIKQKALQANSLPDVLSIVSSLQNNLQTDMTLGDVKDLVSEVHTWNLSDISHNAITDANLLNATSSSDGQYILVPRTSSYTDYSQIHTFVQNIYIKEKASSEVANLKVDVIDASGANLSQNLITNLQNLGLQPTLTIEPPIQVPPVQGIYQYSGTAPDVLQYMENEGLTMQTGSTLPNQGHYNIILVIGKGFMQPALDQ